MKKIWNIGGQLCEWFADKKSCATARGRDLAGAIKGSADQRVVWRSAVQAFSRCGSGFDPSFNKTEKVRVVLQIE